MKVLTSSLVVMLATAAGIASAQAPTTLPPAVTTDAAANAVTVRNDRDVPVTVYLSTQHFDQRLGVVPALATQTLVLPAAAVNQGATVQLVAHPQNSFEDFATDKFTLAPGRFEMVVRAQFAVADVAPTDTMMEMIPPEELDNATVTVDNPRAVPVTVFAESGPFTVRLGQVAPNSRETLRVPKSAMSSFGSIRLFVHPQGGLDLVSGPITARPGDHLGLRVTAH
jgi:hypothetical protein